MLQTVGRAGQVLDLFSTDNPEWGATAVAHELEVAKSQAHELLVSLADIGLLERHGPGRYRLGWRVIALNTLVVDTSQLGAEPTRVLAALAAQTGEAAHLATWGPGSAICVASYAGRDAFGPPPAAVGSALAVHATAAGKVLLAAQPAETIADHAARDLHALHRPHDPDRRAPRPRVRRRPPARLRLRGAGARPGRLRGRRADPRPPRPRRRRAGPDRRRAPLARERARPDARGRRGRRALLRAAAQARAERLPNRTGSA